MLVIFLNLPKEMTLNPRHILIWSQLTAEQYALYKLYSWQEYESDTFYLKYEKHWDDVQPCKFDF